VKLQAIQRAAKQGFDEINQGKGIALKGKTAIQRFIADLEGEVRTKAAKNGVSPSASLGLPTKSRSDET